MPACLVRAAALVATLSLALPIGCSSSRPPDKTTHSMSVASVQLDPHGSTPVLLLEEKEGEQRQLPIWIGLYEAQSIALGLERVPIPRPNPHDLIKNLLDGLEAHVRRVVITELRENTFYAVIDIEVGGEIVSIDARPSDAVAIAIRTGTDVFATTEVLHQAGRTPEGEDAMEIRWRAPTRKNGAAIAISY